MESGDDDLSCEIVALEHDSVEFIDRTPSPIISRKCPSGIKRKLFPCESSKIAKSSKTTLPSMGYFPDLIYFSNCASVFGFSPPSRFSLYFQVCKFYWLVLLVIYF